MWQNQKKVCRQETRTFGGDFEAQPGIILGLKLLKQRFSQYASRLQWRFVSRGRRLRGEEAYSRIGYLPEEEADTQMLQCAISEIGIADDCCQRKTAPDGKTSGREIIRQNQRVCLGEPAKVRLIIALAHEPDLDEPFSGLDPVNTEILKEVVLRKRGRHLLGSCHLTNVEELCDDVPVDKVDRVHQPIWPRRE